MKRFLKLENGILVFASIISCIAITISYRTGMLLAYNDATAHLNTARRIFDSLTPGFVQIGSVWLPLLHILEVPFVANDFLWQSGLAGSIVSAISFVLSALLIYKLVYFIAKDKLAACIGSLAFIFNANILYLQTTAMFEPLLLLTALATVYFLTKWAVNSKLQSLIIGAFFAMLATLTRYDGWALFLASSIFVALISHLGQKKKGKEGLLLIFLVLAGFGIVLWLLYNLMIFSDPLYFQHGEFSAAAQQAVLASRGQLPTSHNIILSLETYSLTTLLNLGFFGTMLMVLGILVFLTRNFRKVSNLGPLLLLVPFVFNIFALYFGQSVIWMPMLPPYFQTYFNARYGILMLPACAFFIGYLIANQKLWLKVIIVTLIIAQGFVFISPLVIPSLKGYTGMVTLKDTVSSVNQDTVFASSYLHDHYSGGLILVSTASSDSFIFRAGLHLNNYITEGTAPYWKESLINPSRYARWIVFFQNYTDRVGKSMKNSSILKKQFALVYTNKTYQIWKLK